MTGPTLAMMALFSTMGAWFTLLIRELDRRDNSTDETS